MKNIITLLGILISLNSFAQEQEVLRLEKVVVPECNCAIYMPKNSAPFNKSYSQDSSMVFTNEYVTSDNFSFGAILVKFKVDLGNDKISNEEMLIMYMDYLKSQLGITASVGYGKGHTMETNPDATGIIDYCEDADGNQYAIKGWIDGGNLAVLYIVGKTEYPVYNVQQMFLDGFRFE